ncbi:hypothetical protein ACLOJK_021643 [Asimina triloba]
MLATANNGMNQENSGINITDKPASKADEVVGTTGEVASAGVASPNINAAGEDGKDGTASSAVAAGTGGSRSSKPDPGPRSGDVGPSQGSKGPVASRGPGSTVKP